MLELAGELPEPEHQGKDWARRTRERLETALETLQAKKLAAWIEYSPTYPDPGESGKGWVERWLSATITLTTPGTPAYPGIAGHCEGTFFSDTAPIGAFKQRLIKNCPV